MKKSWIIRITPPDFIILGAILFVLIYSILSFISNQQSAHQADIVRYNLKIQDILQDKAELEEDQFQYHELINSIIEQIVQNDAAYGLGGGEAKELDYTNEQLLSAIFHSVESRSSDNWFNHVGEFFNARKDYVNNIPNIWPIRKKNFKMITSNFGFRNSPISGNLVFHEGIDVLTTNYGDPVFATADGVVSGYYRNHEVFGKVIWINHANDFSTQYGHLDTIAVEYREKVKRGQLIGYVGDSGLSRGYHLHYGIKKYDEYIDPVSLWLSDYTNN
jgi:murein DD-endopeptidase MepM/ murein hydrolase activator NlpD